MFKHVINIFILQLPDKLLFKHSNVDFVSG